jgi:hypothetical protein
VRLSLLQRTNTQDPITRAITACCALIGGGAVQDAVTDVTAGLIEGHHDGTVTQVTDIQRLADPMRFIISSFHFIIA